MESYKRLKCLNDLEMFYFTSRQPPSKEVSTVWWVWTKSMSTDDNSYHNIRYHGDLNLKALAKFVSTVTKPKMVLH